MRKLALLSFALLSFPLLGCSTEVGSGTDLINEVPASRVELKITLREDQCELAREALGLEDDSAEHRSVTFYDTRELELFERGIILRARHVEGAADDSTIKIRPLTAAQVDADWFSLDGFKCEIDRTSQKSVSSCSLTTTQGGSEIRDVAKGKRSVRKLFSEEQEDFLLEQGGEIDWSTVVPLGPIDAQLWSLQLSGVSPSVTVELWTLPDGRELLEVSTKVPAKEADVTATALSKALEELALDASTTQETKTRTALSYFAESAP